MRFSVQTNELRKVLNALSKVIQKSDINPALHNALLTKTADGVFRLTGSSVDNSLTMNVPLVQTDHEDFKPVCLPLLKTQSILSLLPSQLVEMSFTDKVTNIKYDKGEFDISSYNADEYPSMSELAGDSLEFSLPTSVFLPVVKAAASCAGVDELRLVMSSVAMDVNEEGVVFVSSDGHRLYKYGYTHGLPFLSGGSPRMILIPNNVISAVELPFFNAEFLTVRYDGKRISLHTDTADFIIRAREGRYPNYNSVIPSENPYHIVLDVKELSLALQRMMLVANVETCVVKLINLDGEWNLMGADADFASSAHEALLSDDISLPDKFKIAFNAAHLLSQLKNITSEKVRIEMSDENRAILLREVADNSSLLELIMPVVSD